MYDPCAWKRLHCNICLKKYIQIKWHMKMILGKWKHTCTNIMCIIYETFLYEVMFISCYKSNTSQYPHQYRLAITCNRDGLVQDCSHSIANTYCNLLQSHWYVLRIKMHMVATKSLVWGSFIALIAAAVVTKRSMSWVQALFIQHLHHGLLTHSDKRDRQGAI